MLDDPWRQGGGFVSLCGGIRFCLVDERAHQRLEGLSRRLWEQIEVQGPISVAEYMRECLIHPEFGYYMHRDVFGAAGDFITSPEISQVFGECVGIWCASTMQRLASQHQLHSSNRIRLVELGAGRGTLLSDVARTLEQLQRKCILPQDYQISLHLIDASPELRRIQRETLCGAGDSTVDETPRSIFGKYPVSWHSSLSDLDSDGNVIVLNHEFFDALSVHQLEWTDRGWCERLVDINPRFPDTEETPFRFVLSRGPSLTTLSLLRLPRELTGIPSHPQIGQKVEVSPSCVAVVQKISKLLQSCRGASLIVDYGEDYAMNFTLQAIRDHRFVDLFDSPGKADLSARVNFAALRHAALQPPSQQSNPSEESKCHSSGEIYYHGPVTQQTFLFRAGLEQRLRILLESCGDNDERAGEILVQAQRLVDPEQMGTSYKVAVISTLKSCPIVGDSERMN